MAQSDRASLVIGAWKRARMPDFMFVMSGLLFAAAKFGGVKGIPYPMATKLRFKYTTFGVWRKCPQTGAPCAPGARRAAVACQ